jgi:hypothetical protein
MSVSRLTINNGNKPLIVGYSRWVTKENIELFTQGKSALDINSTTESGMER